MITRQLIFKGNATAGFFKSFHGAYLFIVVDVFVGHAGEKLFEVLPLVALPALPVCLQVGVEALYFVLAFLHLHRHLPRHRGKKKLQLWGPSGDKIQAL